MLRNGGAGRLKERSSRAGLRALPERTLTARAGRAENDAVRPPSTLRRQAGNIAAIILAPLIFVAVTLPFTLAAVTILVSIWRGDKRTRAAS